MPSLSPANPHPEKPMSTSRWVFGFIARTPKHAAGILAFSLAVNLLLLVSPLYMLQIYDRILSSGSIDTLIWLSLIAVFLLAIYAAAEAGRRRLIALAGKVIEQKFAKRIFVRFERGDDPTPRLPTDIIGLTRLQALLQGGAMLAFFDLAFTPLFIGLLYLLDPLLGHIGLAGAVIVFAVACVSERSTRDKAQQAASSSATAQSFAEGMARQRSAMVAMGLTERLFEKWSETREQASDDGLSASKGEGTFSSVSRSLRQVLQVLILGVGAALALSQQISPGGIVAGSVIMSRALAPIDQIVGAWRTLVVARSAWGELIARFDDGYDDTAYTPMPKPKAELSLDRLAVGTPGTDLALIRPFSYTAEASTMVALTGPNGSGKTTLLQTLAGAWPVLEGRIRLGGRDIHQWPSEDRGRHVGYVPQDVELVPGTIAENIARFEQDRHDEVFAAARSIDAHEMIVGLPQGYDTLIGPGGIHLSAGQRQLIGLARAFFGNPSLLLLDEPTANLDGDTRVRIIDAIQARAAAGTIIVASTHDHDLIEQMTIVLMIRNGSILSLPAPTYRSAVAASETLPKLAEVAK